jgi:Peptidase family S41
MSNRHVKFLNRAVAATALAAWSCSVPAQLACNPNFPIGHFEGTATSRQVGKLDVSFNLACDNGNYSGTLVTPAGTFILRNSTLQDDQFGKNHLHFDLESGGDKVGVDALFDGAVLRGTFTTPDDNGPVELRRTSTTAIPAAAERLNLTKEQWHQDLVFLAEELPKRHSDAFHFTERIRFDAAVREFDGKLDGLDADQIYVGMDRIVNLIGDGHTYIRVPADDANLPIDIQRFGDDYRLVAVADGNQNALGTRVIKVEDLPIDQARSLMLPLTPGDETQALQDLRAIDFLTGGIFLHGMGITPQREKVRYTVAGDDGHEFTIDVHAVAPEEKLNWTYAYKQPPLFHQKPDQSFWYVYLPDSRTVYCSFRAYKDLGKESKGLFELIKQQHPDKLVIDLRLNGGGDYTEGLKYLVHPIRDLADVNRKGHLFVLIGPSTFSAAMSNSAHFRYQTNAILVGQQIGEKPNSYQEPREMKLPNSHWTVRYSTKFYKFVETGENVIRPDREIVPTWDDYRSGRDPVLDWVLKYDNRGPDAAH